MERFIIDKSGQVYPAFDDQLAAKFGYPMPDFDLPSYAVRNLGAIDIEVTDLQTIVRFRSLFVSVTALSAAATFLLEEAEGQITIRHDDGEWLENVFFKASDAATWLLDHGRGGGAAFRDMQVTPLPLGPLSERRLSRIEQSHDKLSLAFKKWRIDSGVFNPSLMEFFVRHGLHDRMIIVTEEPADKKIVFQHFGAGFTIFEETEPGWKFTLQGRPVAEQPDKEYAAWIDRAYRQAMGEGIARFDHVDAVVRAPGSNGPDRFIYDRLLLPCRTVNHERMLITCSFGEHIRPEVSGTKK